MTMTRKDYNAIAAAIREVVETQVPSYSTVVMVEKLADCLEVNGGFDVNGNRRFKRERFLQATHIDDWAELAPFEVVGRLVVDEGSER